MKKLKKLISLFSLLMLILTSTMIISCQSGVEEGIDPPQNEQPADPETPSEQQKPVVQQSPVYPGKPAEEVNPNQVVKEFTVEDMELDGMNQASTWAYFTKDLGEFAGNEVTIDLSADVEVENNTAEDYKIWFQVNNNGEYPGVNGETDLFAPGTNKKTITGNVKITINSGALLYLTTHNTTADVKIKITNFKYTVTYVPVSEEPEPDVPAKEYPTDIFTVGEAGTCGIQIGDGELKPFTVYTSGSVATGIKTNDDGSLEWIASAAGGAGGGAAIFINEDESVINFANYESIEVEFVYSPITGAWNPAAQNPGFALRILPWDATGLFGGAEDLIYFEPENKDGYGTYKGTFEITDAFVEKIKNSSDFDAIKAFALKFDDYNRGNSDGDQVKVQLKTVKFNKKADAKADEPVPELPANQIGTVKSIYYPTKDYTVAENAPVYEKHAWVYLPAGYDENDKETKYPVFILLHGFGQNENTWGLSDQGNGGKIKGYMDRRMASEECEKFILVCVTGVASQNWGPNGSGQDFNGFNAFGGELRNDLLPYIRANYNVKEGRDNVALAGLSMGGGQTMNIGIGQSLDLISYFGAFSAAASANGGQYFTDVDAAFPDLDINYLYMICGDADNLVIGGVREINDYITTKGWSKLGDSIATQRYHYTEVPGGTHDFPVWYQGFKEYITYIFK